MPPIRRSNLGRRTRRAIISQNVRDNQTEEERAQQNEWRRANIAQLRAAQSPTQIRQNNTRRRAVLTSFGAEVVDQPGYNPSYKIHGQIHHRAGALLPPPNEDHKFLQIYFVGDSAIELDQRCEIFTATKREIIEQLQNLLHDHNQLFRLFKTALETMHSDDHKIIIRVDKRPAGGHARQFNAPTINEVAVVIVGENVESRDIVLKRRDGGQLQRVYLMGLYRNRE